jgi:drug/metabolite transporter (DMT)-like permease
MKSGNFRAYLAWIIVCIVWGTTYLAIRVGVESLPPMLFAGVRWTTAGSIFIFILRLRGKTLPDKKDFLHMSIMGLSMLGVGNGLVVVGEQWISSGLAALLLTTVPFWIVGIELLASSGPKINLTIITGLLLGLIGVTLIFGDDLSILLDPNQLLGVLCILGAVISWSFGSVYSKYRKVKTHPLMSAAIQMFVAGLAQTITGLSLGEVAEISINQDGLLALIYLTAIASIFGYGSYIYAIEHLPLSLVSSYAYVNPVIAVFLGWMILNEKLNFFIVLGTVIIITGVIIVKKGNEKLLRSIKRV